MGNSAFIPSPQRKESLSRQSKQQPISICRQPSMPTGNSADTESRPTALPCMASITTSSTRTAGRETYSRHSKPRTTTILSASLTIARPKPSTGNSCPKQVRRGSARSTYSPGNQHKWQAPATACTSLCLLTKKGRFTA